MLFPIQSGRDNLDHIYYGEAECRKKNGRFAATLDEVKVGFRPGSAGLHEPLLEVTRHGFEASVEQSKADGGGSGDGSRR